MDLVEQASRARITELLEWESSRGWFIEECEPCGDVGKLRWTGNTFLRFRDPAKVDHCRAVRVHDRPFWLVIWEPLATPAPDPQWTKPYCCYIRHIIFYHRPYVISWDGKEFCQWDRLDHELMYDDLVAFEGETFRVGGATVVWREGAWWMRYRAKREKP